MKTYSSKSAAKKGAKRQGYDISELNFHQDIEGRFYWEEQIVETRFDNENEVSNDTEEEAPTISLHKLCPQPEDDGTEWIEQVEKVASKVALKIEKNRPEQNGIVQPSAGTKCRDIWDHCSAFKFQHARSPSCKEIKTIASELGWNVNNAVIEMYQWRKFHGIVKS